VRRKKELLFFLDVELFRYDNQSVGEALYPQPEFFLLTERSKSYMEKRGVISMAGIAKWTKWNLA
jgi:hypothetical protein